MKDRVLSARDPGRFKAQLKAKRTKLHPCRVTDSSFENEDKHCSTYRKAQKFHFRKWIPEHLSHFIVCVRKILQSFISCGQSLGGLV